eukprot:m.152234 g.152234  ORF g.152234 m.152234 type:complete len:72 (-) comp14315_c0_seq5:2333-2548(-)
MALTLSIKIVVAACRMRPANGQLGKLRRHHPSHLGALSIAIKSSASCPARDARLPCRSTVTATRDTDSQSE